MAGLTNTLRLSTLDQTMASSSDLFKHSCHHDQRYGLLVSQVYELTRYMDVDDSSWSAFMCLKLEHSGLGDGGFFFSRAFVKESTDDNNIDTI